MAEVIVVQRTNVQVDVDEYFGFSRGAVGYRAIYRAKCILAQPAGVAHITNLPS